MTIDEIAEQYDATREQVKAVIDFADKNMSYQQNLTDRKIAFVVIGNQQWPTLRC